MHIKFLAECSFAIWLGAAIVVQFLRFRVAMRAACTAGIVSLVACVASQATLVGAARPPISAALVQIYLEPPKFKYEQIADLAASSSHSFALTATAKSDIVIARLKEAAAQIGATGILLYGVGSRGAGMVGVGISTESESGHSPYGLGFGTSAMLHTATGEAMAIYIESH